MHNDAGASMLSAHTSAPVPPVPVTIKEQGLGVMRSDSNDVWRHANLPLGQHVGSQASMSSPSSFRPPSLTCVDKGPERLKTLLRLSLRASQSPCQSLTTAARMYLPVVEASLDDNGDIRENSNLRDGTRILGKGSFATVYQMILRGGDGVNYALALKVCKVSQLSKVQVTCIERELTIIRAINHSFFLQVFGHWQDSSNFCLLISQAPGGDLFDLLEERQRALGKIDASTSCLLDEETTRFYSAQLVLALKHLQEEAMYPKCIIHRDIKSENVMISSTGYIKLVDFGFAKVLQDKSERTFTKLGTPEYMCPELIHGRHGYGGTVDWWALGVLIYEMLIGTTPFYSTSELEMFKNIVAAKIAFSDKIPRGAKALLKELLAVDESKRLGTNAAQDVCNHAWFRNYIDLDVLVDRQLPAPSLPGRLCW